MLKMVMHWLGYNAIVLFMSLASCMFVYCITVVNGEVERTMREEVLEFFTRHKPMLIAMILLLPVIIWDMLKTSHRVAGPIFKFKAELQRFIDTGKFQSVKLRDDDFLMDFQDTWNEAAERANRELGFENAKNRIQEEDDVIPPLTDLATPPTAESTTLAP